MLSGTVASGPNFHLEPLTAGKVGNIREFNSVPELLRTTGSRIVLMASIIPAGLIRYTSVIQ